MKNIYIASCNEQGGVYKCSLNNEKLEIKEFYPFDRPMFLASNNDKFYIELRQTHDTSSGIVTAKLNNDGTLSDFTPPVATEGIVACHLCVHDEDVYCVNYLSGSVSRIRNGKCDVVDVHSGKGPHPTRQEAPHTHFIGVTPDKKYLVSTDLGIDSVFVYDFDLNVVSIAKVPDGHGARHLVFSNKGDKMYCVNELESTVSVFDYLDGKLTLLGTYPALPNDFEGQNTAAAIRISDDDKYLYVSNRGHNSITCFEICGDTLETRSYTDCGGIGPRDFNIIHNYLICTNENSENVTLFKVDKCKLTKLESELKIKNALCVIFA